MIFKSKSFAFQTESEKDLRSACGRRCIMSTNFIQFGRRNSEIWQKWSSQILFTIRTVSKIISDVAIQAAWAWKIHSDTWPNPAVILPGWSRDSIYRPSLYRISGWRVRNYSITRPQSVWRAM